MKYLHVCVCGCVCQTCWARGLPPTSLPPPLNPHAVSSNFSTRRCSLQRSVGLLFLGSTVNKSSLSLPSPPETFCSLDLTFLKRLQLRSKKVPRTPKRIQKGVHHGPDKLSFMQETTVALKLQEGLLSAHLSGTICKPDFVLFSRAAIAGVTQGRFRMFILANESIF